MTITEIASKLVQGDRLALARAITLAESKKWEHKEEARRIIALARDHKKQEFISRRIGISGAPGVGKSTFIEAFGMEAIRRGHKVAVLAVDPSSATGGGAILGDKTRMTQLARQKNAYVRPSPSGLSSRGIASGTRHAIRLCEAAGFDIILVETVGVGQAETAVRNVVDFFFLLLNPSGGDALQGIKRGIMELADAIIVNKSDGDLKNFAEQTAHEYSHALALMRSRHKEWTPPLTCVSSVNHTDIDTVFDGMNKFFTLMKDDIQLQREQQRSMHLTHSMQEYLEQMPQELYQNLLDQFGEKEALKKFRDIMSHFLARAPSRKAQKAEKERVAA